MLWWNNQTEEHYTWYYDNLYPDFIHDPDENRYINFRYSDSSVSPETMNGYFPWDHLRYSAFLGQKHYDNDSNVTHLEK